MTNNDYVELHTHSWYSLLDGASSPEALVRCAAALGMAALALTDHNALYGAVQFTHAARDAGVCPILGAELTLEDGHHLTLLVDGEQGWQNLCGLISHAQAQAPKGQALLPLAALEGYTDGLVILSGCRQGAVASALLRGDREAARAAAVWLIERFGADRVWVELQHHLRPEDDGLVRELVALAKRLHLGYVATNNVHYVTRDLAPLHDVLVCIRHGITLDEAGGHLRPNSEYFLKPASRWFNCLRSSRWRC